MKKIFYILISLGLAFGDSLPLSEEKIEILKLKRQKNAQDVDVEKNSWISPLIFSASLNNSKDETYKESQTKNAAINWNQDIFRSGGIFYTIEKAEASGQANMLNIDMQEANYLKKIYTLASQIKRDTLKHEQSELILKNRDIDLFIIKEKYKAGSTDISELNRATIDRDHARTDLIAAKNILRNEQHELKKLAGYKTIETIILPDIALISKSEYLKQHLELLKYQAEDKSQSAIYKISQSSYLPKLALNASYGYTQSSGDIVERDGENYRYGAMLSMPLDINAKSAIESERLQLLETRLTQIDRKLELEQEYEMRFATISDYEEKITVAQDMLNLYNELQTFTQSQVDVGLKSSYELDSLKNSVTIQELEKEMQFYNILIEKISLHFDTKQ